MNEARIPPRYIVVEGPIGVGKTSLVERLAERLGGRKLLEAAADNPFLAGFYKDGRRYAFQTQLWFLLNRFRQQQELAQWDLFRQTLVSDYLFAKDKIFAYLTLDDSELMIFDALKLPDGPTGRLKLPFRLRSGLQGTWADASKLTAP